MGLISSATILPLRQDAVAAQLTWTQLCNRRWWSSSSVSMWSVSVQLYLHGTSGTSGAPPTMAAPSPDQNTRPITGKVTADVGKTRERILPSPDRNMCRATPPPQRVPCLDPQLTDIIDKLTLSPLNSWFIEYTVDIENVLFLGVLVCRLVASAETFECSTLFIAPDAINRCLT